MERSQLLASIRLGLSRDECVTILGKPDAVGGTSRKYRTPRVFKYGDIELCFEPWKNGHLVMIHEKSLAKNSD